MRIGSDSGQFVDTNTPLEIIHDQSIFKYKVFSLYLVELCRRRQLGRTKSVGPFIGAFSFLPTRPIMARQNRQKDVARSFYDLAGRADFTPLKGVGLMPGLDGVFGVFSFLARTSFRDKAQPNMSLSRNRKGQTTIFVLI